MQQARTSLARTRAHTHTHTDTDTRAHSAARRHRRNICSNQVLTTPGFADAKVVTDKFCANVASPGTRLLWAGVCVQKAPATR